MTPLQLPLSPFAAPARADWTTPWRSAEFFAGIGLVRAALEAEGIRVVWSNDIEAAKRDLYIANFGAFDFLLGDVRGVEGGGLPDVDLATASFPCTDLSLAGGRAGLDGQESSMFWEFARVIQQMGCHKPRVVLLENVTGFATSRGGSDLKAALEKLNDLGYWCDLFVLDARWFVPQSRPRMFIIGSLTPLSETVAWDLSPLRPEWLTRFVARHRHLRLQAKALSVPLAADHSLEDVVERIPEGDVEWWDDQRLERFVASLSPLQLERLAALKAGRRLCWRTAYRRTRQGRAVWEIRADDIAGCLRTARGGSSKQALVEAGCGQVRARWMTPREYARLQGVPDSYVIDHVRPSQAYFGFGDAVCVPAVAWIAREYLVPLLAKEPVYA